MSLLPHDLSLDARHHLDSLVSTAARALRAGQYVQAFALADRRCRIPPAAEASHYLLRAAALARLGDRDGAQEDMRRALEIDPENLVANRSLLAGGSTDERRRAAEILLRHERRWPVLAEAVANLAKAGIAAVGSMEASLLHAQGWFAWCGRAPLQLRVTWQGGEEVMRLDPDPAHPLAPALGSAANWAIPWPGETEYLDVRTLIKPSLVTGTTLLRPRREKSIETAAASRKPAHTGGRPSVAIIVPVYSDYDATRLCLHTLLADRPREVDRRIIVVNDASPDVRITQLLIDLARRNTLTLIHNEHNLGFARATNRALRMLDAGEDALLLNADTVLPRGFLDRLAGAAHAGDDIGTVTPLSNNGEYTSFPVPFTANDLPSPEAVAACDRIAAKVNRGRLIDLPNGTGFCMYVTRACIDRVGLLSESFGRGYVEDVELCLRAACAGFRNVCAADVFIGHAGSRSFRGSKRALVMRNLVTLEHRFPGYRTASAAFMECDPLRGARQSVELASLIDAGPAHLLVVSETCEPHAVEERAQALRAQAAQVWIATARLAAGWVTLGVRNVSEEIPQSLRFSYPLADAEEALCRDLRSLPIERVEFTDIAATPAPIVKAVQTLGIAHDQIAGGTGLGRTRREKSLTSMECESGTHDPGANRCLAIVSQDRSIGAASELADLIRHLGDANVPLALFGSTFDDLRVMATSNAHVTGPVEPDELPALVRRLNVSHLFLSHRRGNDLSYRRAAQSCGKPIACFGGRTSAKRASAHLNLSPAMQGGAVALALQVWMSPAEHGNG